MKTLLQLSLCCSLLFFGCTKSDILDQEPESRVKKAFFYENDILTEKSNDSSPIDWGPLEYCVYDVTSSGIYIRIQNMGGYDYLWTIHPSVQSGDRICMKCQGPCPKKLDIRNETEDGYEGIEGERVSINCEWCHFDQ